MYIVFLKKKNLEGSLLWPLFNKYMKCNSMIYQVFAIELVTFAVDFVLLAVEFGTFAVEFDGFAVKFIMLAL